MKHTFQLVLLRHGKTEANLRHLFCGQTDLPLAASGRQLLQAATAAGVYPPVEQVFCSSMRRAVETAAILVPNLTPILLSDLREYDFGDYEGFSHQQLQDRADYTDWVNDDIGEISPPHGENRTQFMRRALRGMQQIAAACAAAGTKTALLVTHGGIIASLLLRWFPGQQNYGQWQPQPGYGYLLQITYDPVSHTEMQVTILRRIEPH
ncbi:MAG: histidine phosphatase family protein [Negativicutes bacterium]|nr:histidine phosphatase family protein [Negativicutes bacterium]